MSDPLKPVHDVADTVGFAPNLRPKDNLIQLASVLGSVVLAGGVGFLRKGAVGGILGAIAGMIGGLLVSGLILGIVRLARKS